MNMRRALDVTLAAGVLAICLAGGPAMLNLQAAGLPSVPNCGAANFVPTPEQPIGFQADGNGWYPGAAPNEALLQMVCDLPGEADPEMRALGQEQVRGTDVRGPDATKRPIALLPSLPADAQAGLVEALAVGCLEDPAVADEAGTAVVRMAERLSAGQRDQVCAALEQVLRRVRHPEVRARAQQMLDALGR